jgi:hypothetical protein
MITKKKDNTMLNDFIFTILIIIMKEDRDCCMVI